jgi:hypothetical protein
MGCDDASIVIRNPTFRGTVLHLKIWKCLFTSLKFRTLETSGYNYRLKQRRIQEERDPQLQQYCGNVGTRIIDVS